MLEVKLGDDIDSITQVFLESSFYDLIPIAQGFWREIFDLSIKLYAAQTFESVRIYSE